MDELRVSTAKIQDAGGRVAAEGSPFEAFDMVEGLDPFRQVPEAQWTPKVRMSPRSPIAPNWDPSPSGSERSSAHAAIAMLRHQSSDNNAASILGRSSLDQHQSHDRVTMQHVGRSSMDRVAMQHVGRNSMDLANEIHLQQLHLATIQAQLQLQQVSALQQSLAAVQQQRDAAPDIDQLAQAITQLQMSNGLSTPNQIASDMLSTAMVPPQANQPNMAHVIQMQMLMQQQQQQQQQQQLFSRGNFRGNFAVNESCDIFPKGRTGSGSSNFSIPEEVQIIESEGNACSPMKGLQLQALISSGLSGEHTMLI